MIKFSANIRSACAESDDAITTRSVGIPVQLDLSAEFNGLAKTLVFSDGVNSVDLVLLSDAAEAKVPPDVLTTPGRQLQIGIYAADASGNIVIPTVVANVDLIRKGAVPSGADPLPPTPSWAAQLQQLAETAVEDAEKSADDAALSADAAEASAERAEQAAANAGYMYFYIDGNGNLIFKRTPNTTVDFYLQDGNLYVKAVD